MLNILIGTLIITAIAMAHIWATLFEGSTFEKIIHYAMLNYNVTYVGVFIALTTIALFLIIIGIRSM